MVRKTTAEVKTSTRSQTTNKSTEDTVDIDRQELLATKWQNIKMILDRK